MASGPPAGRTRGSRSSRHGAASLTTTACGQPARNPVDGHHQLAHAQPGVVGQDHPGGPGAQPAQGERPGVDASGRREGAGGPLLVGRRVAPLGVSGVGAACQATAPARGAGDRRRSTSGARGPSPRRRSRRRTRRNPPTRANQSAVQARVAEMTKRNEVSSAARRSSVARQPSCSQAARASSPAAARRAGRPGPGERRTACGGAGPRRGGRAPARGGPRGGDEPAQVGRLGRGVGVEERQHVPGRGGRPVVRAAAARKPSSGWVTTRRRGHDGWGRGPRRR